MTTKVGFQDFHIPIVHPGELNVNLVVGLSEIIWSNPFSFAAKSVCNGEIQSANYETMDPSTAKSIKSILVVVRAVAFAVFATATYFKPKWGLALASITLIPKVCHRGLMTIPPKK